MSDHDLRLAERAEDAHARSLERAEEAIRIYEADAHWWPVDATNVEIATFASRVLRALQLPAERRLSAIYEARRAAFTETAMRRARVED